MRDNPVVLARFAIGAGGLALGMMSLVFARTNEWFLFSEASPVDAAVWVVAGWLLLAGGVVFGTRRKSNRVVPLLVAASCVWLIAGWDLPRTPSAPAFTIGLLATGACPPLIGWVMLGYPTGRLAGWVEKTSVVAALTAGVILLGLAGNLFFDPQATGCTQCPDNLMLLTHDPAAVVLLGRIGLVSSALTVVGLVAVAWSSFVRASGPRRRVVAPLYLTASAYLLAATSSYVAGVDRGFVGSDPLQRRLWLVQAGALVSVGLAAGWTSVRVRRTRSQLAQIVVELIEKTTTGGLRDALARTLDDPELELAYPIADGRFVDSSGRPIAIPSTGGRSATALIRDGGTVGILVHRPGLLDDPDLVMEVASAARLGLENERLQADLRAQEESIRVSRARIVVTADSERHRLERDLHDGAQQRLIALLLGLRLVPIESAPSGGGDVNSGLEAVVTTVQRAIDELRAVAHGVHPAVLSDEGLAAAIEALAEEAILPLTIDSLPEERYSAAVENAAYRLVAETAKAGATRVRAVRRDGNLIIEMAASGPPERIVELEDRIGALNGAIAVRERPGGAVDLRAEIPCG
ncbi:MAG TPA: histidine kinase [Acidimicrobiia bacterium]|nr:histidine kinase [Acidimicrobiia bacterium]